MENTNDSGKLFGNLALGLLVAGLLVPFIIAMLASEQLAMGFGVVAVVLALVFGIAGWKHKTGKVAVIICAGLAVLALAIAVLLLQTTKVREENRREQVATRISEQRTERDSQ
jgi:chromate transport protein ChrA